MFRTIRDPTFSLAVSTRAINIPLLLSSSQRGGRFTRRDVTERATFTGTIEGGGGGRDPKQKETERCAFELNYFHFRTRSASLFVPANGIHRDAVAMGRVGFRPRSAVGRVSVSLSPWLRKRQWKRGERFEVFVRGGVNRPRPFRCRCPLPVSCLVSSRVAFDIFIFRNYHVRFFVFKLI